MKHLTMVVLFLLLLPAACQAQEKPNTSCVFPHLAMVTDLAPRSESGTGGLLPWTNRLWVVTYVAHKRGTVAGTGLYSIDLNVELES